MQTILNDPNSIHQLVISWNWVNDLIFFKLIFPTNDNQGVVLGMMFTSSDS